MNKVFRRMPLTAKLMVILLVPLALLVYISIQLYFEKSQKVRLIEGYIEGIQQSANINSLIEALQNERRLSFDYTLKQDFKSELIKQRPKTDSAIRRLQMGNKQSLKGFPKYTFLDKLAETRAAIDTGNMKPNDVMHYYITIVFRLNTLNPAPIESDIYLESLHKEIMSQKILSEMMTYLGIIRSNIYNVLHTRKYMLETLFGLLGTHQVYDTYEIELFEKASPEILKSYKKIKSTSALKPTMAYIDSLFKRFRFDSSYDAETWWQVSANGVAELQNLQMTIWKNVENKINEIYENEKQVRSQTIIFLLLGMIAVISIVLYVISIIKASLREVRQAAEKISRGETGFKFGVFSDDVVGALSESVKRIDQNNKILAEAADAIGKGDFQVHVQPRSPEDILGNALVKMKHDLQLFANEKDLLLVKKDEFMSIASHELKTPMTSVKAALQIIERITSKDPAMQTINSFVLKANKQVTRLANIVNDLLDITKIQSGKLELNKTSFRIKELMDESIDQLQYNLSGHSIMLRGDLGQHVQIYADRHRMEQVMINLLSNAIKYSPAANEIFVTVKLEDSQVLVSVQDFGIGISQDKTKMIFDRFFRVEASSQNFSGLGLGLYISSEIVKRHKGNIGVDSVMGEGSIFWFTLPI